MSNRAGIPPSPPIIFITALLTALSALALSRGLFAQNALPKGILPTLPARTDVIATVNGTPIRAGDIEPELWEIWHRPIEEDYIDYLSVKSLADKDGVSVSDDDVKTEVDKALNVIKARIPGGVPFQSALNDYPYFTSESRMFLREKTRLLMEKIQMLSFHSKDWIRVSALIWQAPTSQPDVAKKSGALALDAYAKLQKGASWTQLLTQLVPPPAPNVLKTNGDVGWHELTDFPPAVRDQFSALKPGMVTKPEIIEARIEIFRLDVLGPDAVGNDRKELEASFVRRTYSQTANEVKAQAKVVRLLP